MKRLLLSDLALLECPQIFVDLSDTVLKIPILDPTIRRKLFRFLASCCFPIIRYRKKWRPIPPYFTRLDDPCTFISTSLTLHHLAHLIATNS
jgi:hypothetical protein